MSLISKVLHCHWDLFEKHITGNSKFHLVKTEITTVASLRVKRSSDEKYLQSMQTRIIWGTEQVGIAELSEAPGALSIPHSGWLRLGHRWWWHFCYENHSEPISPALYAGKLWVFNLFLRLGSAVGFLSINLHHRDMGGTAWTEACLLVRVCPLHQGLLSVGLQIFKLMMLLIYVFLGHI